MAEALSRPADFPAEAAPAPPLAPSIRREYGLDWLRVIAFLILIGYHTGMYFVPWPWMVKNRVTSQWLTWVMTFFNLWRLPLLFFISGAGTWFNLRRRGYGSFARERLRRLGLPLVFGMFVIVAPQVWVMRVLAGRHYASYFEFWGTVFTTGAYPRGNLSWMHLWFLPYILTYSLVGLPLFAWLRGPVGRRAVDGFAKLCERPGVIYLLSLPAGFAASLLMPHWPRTDNLFSDWAYFTHWGLFFFWGFVIGGSERFLALVERRRRELLCVAAALGVLLYAFRIDGVLPFDALARGWITGAVDINFGMVMVLMLVGWARAKFNRLSPALTWANTAVYPLYVVHQTITVLLGYWWLGWNPPFAVKFPMLFAGTFVGSWLAYELVRRTWVTRMLFGMSMLPDAPQADLGSIGWSGWGKSRRRDRKPEH